MGAPTDFDSPFSTVAGGEKRKIGKIMKIRALSCALLVRMEWDGFLLDASVVSYWALIFCWAMILVRE